MITCPSTITRYTQQVGQVSRTLQDQPQTPLERAVFWTEYVIRHRGAPHLRSPAASLSWTQFLMLDVLVLLILTGVITCCILCTTLRALVKVVMGTTGTKEKKE